jgi:osmotically-inducible protein OsmY
MARSAALLVVPAGGRTDKEIERIDALTPLLMQSMEDIRLAERVARALRADGQTTLRDIEVVVQAGLVILSGRVHSYYLKQLAQETALTVPGAHQVRNDLEVGRPS